MKTAVSFGKPETGFEEIKGQRHIARPRFPQEDFGTISGRRSTCPDRRFAEATSGWLHLSSRLVFSWIFELQGRALSVHRR
jgi:hypothetical protein